MPEKVEPYIYTMLGKMIQGNVENQLFNRRRELCNL